MKQNTFEPCKDHENGHFNWCLLCEIDSLRNSLKLCREISESRRENILALEERISDLCDRIYRDTYQKSDNPVHDIVSSWCK